MTETRNVALTGVGLIHPHGRDLASLAAALEVGRPPESPYLPELEYEAFFPSPSKRERRMDDVGQLACCTALLALRDAGLAGDLGSVASVGLFGGTMFGGLSACVAFHRELLLRGPDSINPVHFPNTAHNVAMSQVAINLGIRGPIATLTGGLGAGLDAVLAGARSVRSGRVDVAIVGGFDRWCSVRTEALETLHLVVGGGRGSSCVPVEGACFLVLEGLRHAEGRSAEVLALLSGWSQRSDPSPRRGSTALARALERAMLMAGKARDGNGTADLVCPGVQGNARYDHLVDAAYRQVFGETHTATRLEPKRVLGETFGAAGPFAIAAAFASGVHGRAALDAVSWGGAASALILDT